MDYIRLNHQYLLIYLPLTFGIEQLKIIIKIVKEQHLKILSNNNKMQIIYNNRNL